MIRAECHTDDFRRTARFDATPWFEQAGQDEIVALARAEWGGDYEADEVARFFDGKAGYEDVSAMFGGTGDGVGFECHVHEADALIWLAGHRPEIVAAVAAALDQTVEELVPKRAGTPYWDEDSSWEGDYNAAPAGAPAP